MMISKHVGKGYLRDGEDRAMERYLEGEEAFADLYRALAPPLLTCLRSYTPDEASAEDLLQLTFLTIHRCRARFIRGSALRPWALAIARRLAIDLQRRKEIEARYLTGDEPSSGPDRADDLLHAHQLRLRLESGLHDLPPSQRVALELIRGEGLSLAQAAVRLGVSVNAVKVRTHRAHRALLRMLEKAS
jgi:RNA polymerase sigma-70 factor (ECF subfamily)